MWNAGKSVCLHILAKSRTDTTCARYFRPELDTTLTAHVLSAQGSNVDVYASQPGLVNTELNGRKLDHGKFSANAINVAAKTGGQKAEIASYCLQRPAADPAVTGASPRLQL